jgi:hypothetical protein
MLINSMANVIKKTEENEQRATRVFAWRNFIGGWGQIRARHLQRRCRGGQLTVLQNVAPSVSGIWLGLAVC